MRVALLTVGLIVSCTAAFAAQTPAEPVKTTPASITATARTEAAKAEPLTTTTAAKAQEEPGVKPRTRAMLGVALKTTTTPSGAAANGIKPSFIWKWRGKFSRQDDRFGFAYGLNSFNSRFSSVVGGQTLAIGNVKSRPIMVGAEYKMPRGKWQYSAGVQAGWSMNGVDTKDKYRAAFRQATGSEDLWMDVRNSFVWAPKGKAWYDINRRLALQFDVAYFMARPEMTMRVNGVESRGRLNADAFVAKIGFLYGIF